MKTIDKQPMRATSTVRAIKSMRSLPRGLLIPINPMVEKCVIHVYPYVVLLAR